MCRERGHLGMKSKSCLSEFRRLKYIWRDSYAKNILDLIGKPADFCGMYRLFGGSRALIAAPYKVTLAE